MDFIGFKAVLRRRHRLFKRVMSLHIDDTPVLQPSSAQKETFHIVEITVDGTAVLQLLFRQSDGYLIAFRLVRNKENPLAWKGWFQFKDGDIFLPRFFGERKLMNLDCGYEHAAEVTICRDTMHHLVACLLDFKPANCTKTSYGAYDREIMLETLMVFLGECQRSGVFLDFVEHHHDSKEPQPVGQELNDHLHSWSNLSKAILHIHLAILLKLYGERSWEVELEKAEGQLKVAVSALTAFDFNLIKSYIVYHTKADGTITDRPDALLSMPSLLGSEVGHLLHLIKCDDEHVQEIHKLMKKHRQQWPDPGTDPDTEPEPEPDSEEPS